MDSKVIFLVLLSALLSACVPGVLPVGSPAVPSTIEPSLLTDTPAAVLPGSGVISLSTAQEVVLLHVLDGHTGRVLDVVFSAGGKYLVSSSQDMTIRLWDVSRGLDVHTIRMRSVDMAGMDVSNNGNLLASGEAIWDLDRLQEMHVLERGSQLPAFVAFSPDGSVLALGIIDRQITLWDVKSGQPLYTLEKQGGNRTKRMDFSPDGTLLAAGVIDGTIRLFDVASGKIIHVFQYGGETDNHALAFSPDGRYLATGGRMPAVVLWDVESREIVRTFRLTDNAISLDFSPDGRLLASAGGSKHEIRLWDVESGSLLYSLPHDDQLTSVAFSPDGRQLAVGCFDNRIYIWGIPLNP